MKQKNKEDYQIGCLVEFLNITYVERNILIKLLSTEYSYVFQVLFNIIEDDATVLKLVDIFADRRIKFPSRQKVYKLLEKIKIYTYAKNHKFSPESISVLSKQYEKRPSQIKLLIERINKVLDNSEYLKEVGKDD